MVIDTVLRLQFHREYEWEYKRDSSEFPRRTTGQYSEWELTRLSGDPVELWSHKQRGGIYAVIAEGQLQVPWPDDMAEAVAYIEVTTSKLWFRKKSEFEDGRFVRVDIALADLLGMIETAEAPKSDRIADGGPVTDQAEHNGVGHR